MKRFEAVALVFLAATLAFPLSTAATAAGAYGRSSALSATINRAIRAGGPFFTPAERAVIERKCGYAPGEYDGYNANVQNGIFYCTNGRKVDDPEMRALLEVANPRIKARVTEAMARPGIQAAIHDEAVRAAHEALANLKYR